MCDTPVENIVDKEIFDLTSEDIEQIDIVDDSLLDYNSNEIQYIYQAEKIEKVAISLVASDNVRFQQVIIPESISDVHKNAVEIFPSQIHESKNNLQIM